MKQARKIAMKMMCLLTRMSWSGFGEPTDLEHSASMGLLLDIPRLALQIFSSNDHVNVRGVHQLEYMCVCVCFLLFFLLVFFYFNF